MSGGSEVRQRECYVFILSKKKSLDVSKRKQILIHISIAVNKSETEKTSYGIHIKCSLKNKFLVVLKKK